ncbi:hydrogenase subunit MbhD domain-containing protein [Petrotoga sp. 9PWA.NaAc.5.4]|uniref:hydrogenase subunit MbhD domain-containing protein n=1 Tax=Petrotoga sp. 9PWA.NaAc.5.4 TaxID=1434328 RepID=UPI000EFA3E73|nr:hydrogenase subunit MbhD domain-containing protein [Petrotoga sp. 9PWA.NaAc.5.4]
MNLSIIFLLGCLIIFALYTLIQDNHLYAIIGYGIFSVSLSVLFFLLNAPDVAFVEITVGAAFVIFIYILAIKKNAEITIYYLETPYLIEKKDNKLHGFEYEIIKNFLERKGLDADFIKVDDASVLEKLKDHGAILVGGIIFEDNKEFLASKPIINSKLYVIGEPKKAPVGIFLPDIETFQQNDLDNDFVIDEIRLQTLKNSLEKLETTDLKIFKRSGYRIIFSKKDSSLLKDFNKYISEIKKDRKYYKNLIRRYFG